MTSLFPYAVAILKPDVYRDTLSEMIIDDIEQADFDIVFRKDVALSQNQAEGIYSKEKNSQYFKNAVKSLLGTEKNRFTTLLVLKFKKTEGDSIAAAQEIKGEVDRGGVRGKYFLRSKEILERMGFAYDDLEDELRKNRIHVPDTQAEVLEVINMLITEKEKMELGEREPELYRELTRVRENREISGEINREISTRKRPR